MPSPYAHTVAGVILATPWLQNKQIALKHKEDIATILGFSLAPDLDVIPGFITNDLPSYHNQFSHSILFGISICLIYAGFRLLLPAPKSFMRTAIIAASAYGLHLLMDLFTYGRGLKLFWPITNQRFHPPFLLFYGVRHSEGWFSYHHWITIATESLTMLPLLAVAWLFARQRRTCNEQ